VSPATIPTRFRFDTFELDSESGEVRNSGTLLKLQPQPFRVLLLLIERAGQVVTREEIQRRLWTESTFVDFEHGINFSINQIRRALADNAEKPRYVETLPKRGYRFICVVERPSLLEQSATSQADLDARYQSTKKVQAYPRRLGTEGLESPSRPARRGKSPRLILAVSVGGAVIVLACVALGIHLWKSHQGALNLEEMQIVRLTESGKAEDVAISPNGEYVVYVLREGEQRSLILRQTATGNEVQILPPAVVELRSLQFSPDGNHIFFLRTPIENFLYDFLYQMPVLGGTPRKLIRDIDTPISFSPDGKQFAFVRIGPTGGTHLMIANADGSAERILASHPGESFDYPSWSPDGKTIAFPGPGLPGEGHLWAVSPVDARVHSFYKTRSSIGRVRWLPDGSGLLAVIRDPAQGRGQLWYISYPSGEARRVTNDLADYALGQLDLTRDGKSLVMVDSTISSDLWVVHGGDAARAQQITSGRAGVRGISAGPERTIVFANQKSDLYSIHDDGSAFRLLTPNMHHNANPSVCRDGQHIVFESAVGGQTVSLPGRASDIWRMDADGSHVAQLTQSGNAVAPLCSPDSESVLYFDIDQKKNWRIPIVGGTPTQVDIKSLGAVARSYTPDGKLIAYNDYGLGEDVPNQIVVFPAAGGEAIYKFPFPQGGTTFVQWTPDGTGLDYFLTNNGVGNIWRQPVPKGLPSQITNFTSGQIFSFDRSSDGEQLYVARGSISSDIVLITNFR
jgi:Tol biopolymer transport system component/DNA-binding winged helix-turn-helix (wHTH) protein